MLGSVVVGDSLRISRRSTPPLRTQALEQQALAAELLRLLVARERVCAEGLSEQQRRFAWEQANPTRRAWHQLEQELEGPELLVPPLEVSLGP